MSTGTRKDTRKDTRGGTSGGTRAGEHAQGVQPREYSRRISTHLCTEETCIRLGPPQVAQGVHARLVAGDVVDPLVERPPLLALKVHKRERRQQEDLGRRGHGFARRVPVCTDCLVSWRWRWLGDSLRRGRGRCGEVVQLLEHRLLLRREARVEVEQRHYVVHAANVAKSRCAKERGTARVRRMYGSRATRFSRRGRVHTCVGNRIHRVGVRRHTRVCSPCWQRSARLIYLPTGSVKIIHSAAADGDRQRDCDLAPCEHARHASTRRTATHMRHRRSRYGSHGGSNAED